MQRGISTDSDDDASQQCCLKALHIFLSSCVLLVSSAGVLIMSYFWKQETLLPFRTPCVAILCLSAVIAVASGSLAAFVEMRLQDRWVNLVLLIFNLFPKFSINTRTIEPVQPKVLWSAVSTFIDLIQFCSPSLRTRLISMISFEHFR